MNIPTSAIQQMNGLNDGLGFCNDVSKRHNKPKAIDDALQLYYIDRHPIKSTRLKPDKIKYEQVPTGYDENGIPKPPRIQTGTIKLQRNALDIVRYIIDQKVTLVTGAGVGLDAENTESKLYQSVLNNWEQSKFEFDLGEVARTMMAETQCAIILFGSDDVLKKGFKYRLVSPSRGDVLIPLFDEESGDMIGFQREYKLDKKNIIDLYYKENGKVYLRKIIDKVEQDTISLPYLDLPIIYFEQDESECQKVADLLYSFEDEFNNFIDGCRYYADPILFGKGGDMNLPQQSDAGKVMLSKDAQGDLKFVTPDNATEMRNLQFDMMQKYIFMLTHSVQLDGISLSGLGNNLSGELIERLMTDAYMDADKKQKGEFGKGVQRLVNWLTNEWRELTKDADDMRIKASFRKYSLRSEVERADLYLKLNGNQPLISHKESVQQADFANDVDFINESVV